MGQIVFNGQKPKYANKLAITTGEKANAILDENEIWLIDSTVDSVSSTDFKSSTGTGKYDKYIKGDGQTAARNLPLLNIENGGEGAATNVDNEDLGLATEEETSVIKFKDKEYEADTYSGYGRKYLRKNIVTEDILEKVPISIVNIPDNTQEGSATTPATINNAMDTIDGSDTNIAARITHAYWDLNAGEGGVAILNDRDTTNNNSIAGHWSIGYIVAKVTAGEVYNISANFVSQSAGATAGYFWAVINNITDKTIIQCDGTGSSTNTTLSAVVSIENDGILVVNHISYLNPPYRIIRHVSTGSEKDFNILLNSDVAEPNTRYIVQYDYDLNYRELILPANSVLVFQGGSIRNGYIKGSNTTIEANKAANIFGRNTEIIGTWTNRTWHYKWFGAASNGTTDDTDVLEKMLNLPVSINKVVLLDWYGGNFRTTRGLYIKSNTTIKGGTIRAKFANQMAWILKTYNYYAAVGKVYGENSPGALASWQDNDHGYASSINNSTIEDITLIGELNEHYTEVVENEGTENETVTRELDGTYTPIFGGLCIMVSNSVNTKNVSISNVGVGIARGACLKTCDDGLNVNAIFVGFAGYAINGHSIRDSYLNAKCKSEESSTSTKVTPYYKEYQSLVTLPKSGYIYGDGGTNLIEENNRRPYSCNIQLSYCYSLEADTQSTNELPPELDEQGSVIGDNILVDKYAEVFLCATHESIVSLRHPWFEAVNKCLIYSNNSRVVVDAPYVYSTNDYDIIAESGSIISLRSAGGSYGIHCAGGINGTTKKYSLSNNSRVNVLDARISPYPVDDNRFYFLSEANYISMPMITVDSSSIENNTFTASSGFYYKFSGTIDNITIVLPAMTATAFLRTVMFYFKVGEDHNITFTSANGAAVRTFGSYKLDGYATYEINCMYNGSEWIIGSAEIYL